MRAELAAFSRSRARRGLRGQLVVGWRVRHGNSCALEWGYIMFGSSQHICGGVGRRDVRSGGHRAIGARRRGARREIAHVAGARRQHKVGVVVRCSDAVCVTACVGGDACTASAVPPARPCVPARPLTPAYESALGLWKKNVLCCARAPSLPTSPSCLAMSPYGVPRSPGRLTPVSIHV